ncbi:MAG: hypothetical protein AB7K24_29270, partial [Gemmataceae bacterium]
NSKLLRALRMILLARESHNSPADGRGLRARMRADSCNVGKRDNLPRQIRENPRTESAFIRGRFLMEDLVAASPRCVHPRALFDGRFGCGFAALHNAAPGRRKVPPRNGLRQ